MYFSRKKKPKKQWQCLFSSISLSFQFPLLTHLYHTVHHLQPSQHYLTTSLRLMHKDSEIVTKDKKEINLRATFAIFCGGQQWAVPTTRPQPLNLLIDGLTLIITDNQTHVKKIFCVQTCKKQTVPSLSHLTENYSAYSWVVDDEAQKKRISSFFLFFLFIDEK